MDQRLYNRMYEADCQLMSEQGLGVELSKYDARLKAEVVLFNGDYGTLYDPITSLHDYLEAAEANQ